MFDAQMASSSEGPSEMGEPTHRLTCIVILTSMAVARLRSEHGTRDDIVHD